MARDVEIQRRLAISRVPINKQEPSERKKNWDEVFLGFDPESAKTEAMRCIQCPTAPCQQACPVQQRHSRRVQAARARRRLRRGRACSARPATCRSCAAGSARRSGCARASASSRSRSGRTRTRSRRSPSASSRRSSPTTSASTAACRCRCCRHRAGFSVAVVGAGPAGLAVAEELAKHGHSATMYDAWPEPGGVLLYGIPNFKLSKDVLQDKLEYLEKLGVKFVGNTWVGKDVTVDDLFDAGVRRGVRRHGRRASAASSRSRARSSRASTPRRSSWCAATCARSSCRSTCATPLTVGKDVVVIGGGDTSMDCVRTAVRLGAEHVTCVYRRTEAEMLGRTEERQHAREEGVDFQFLTIPLRFIGDDDGHVTGRRVPADGARRAGRVRAPAAGPDPGLGVRHPGGQRRDRHRLQRRPDHQGCGAGCADEPLEPCRGRPRRRA